jgi:phosphoribosylformimino-5-aminoimidazole carboxamide ribotide isomerase
VAGWTETSETEAAELAALFEDAGVAAIVHTDIARDGMGTGPNLEATSDLARAISIPVIASGGVGSVGDVEAAARIGGLAGIIIGRALYTGAVDLRRALSVASCS